MASNGLTEEQKKRMEENRLRAIQLRQSKLQSSSQGQGNPPNNKSLFASSSAITISAVSPKTPKSKPVSYQNGSVKRKAESSTTSNYFAKAPKTSVKIILDSHSRLNIQFQYKEDIVAVVKSMKTSRYLTEGRKWTIHIDDYPNFMNALKAIGDHVVVDAASVPARVVSLIQSHMQYHDVEVDLLEKFDQQFLDSLFPFQREAIIFGIQRNGKCLLADDMGLGKTVQALGIVGWFRTDWPVCIACPASVAVAWKQATLRWLGTWVKEDDIQMLDTKPPSFGPKFFIGSYERLGKWSEEFVRRRIPTIILDECHNIKSDSAKRTAAALKISKEAKHVILISGTPALSRPIELYTQLAALNQKLFTNKHDFGVRYCAAYQAYHKGPRGIWDYRGHSNTDELKMLLESTVMIRRLKSDVLKDLPPKNRVVIRLPLKISEEERIELDKLRNRVGNANNFHSENPDLMAWYRETGRLKVTAVLDYLARKLDRVGKMIIFAHHKVLLTAISDWLKTKGVKHIVITGETNTAIRQDLCDEFQQSPSCRAAVVSIMAAGVGITLTAANLVIFAELTWNPGALNQAEDRAHRIGQEENVTIEYLVSPDTCDEQLWSIIERKLAVLGKVGLSKDIMKDSAQRDANQSLIEDYFSPKSKAKKVKQNEAPAAAAAAAADDDDSEIVFDDDGFDDDLILLD